MFYCVIKIQFLGSNILLNNVIYFFVLFIGAVYGFIKYGKFLRFGKLITFLFNGIFILESTVAIFRSFEISNAVNYLTLTVFLFVMNYFIFGNYLKFNKKNTKRYNVLSLSFFLLIIVNSFFVYRNYEFPFLSVALFCLYSVVLSVIGFFQLMDSPTYIPLLKNPLFLFSFANLSMYSVKFWNLSFRPVLYKIPLEVLIENEFLLFHLSAICMNVAYLSMLYILFIRIPLKDVNAQGNKKRH